MKFSSILSKRILFLCVLFGVSIAYTGYRIYQDNHALQLPLMHLLRDSSLYPRDPFAATLPFYSSLLWDIANIAQRFFSIEQICSWGFFGTRLLMIFAASELAISYTPGKLLPAIGAMVAIAFAPNPVIGSGTIVMNYFEQTGLSIAFFMLACAAFYSRRRYLWAIWFAIGFDLNSMYGVYAATYFLSSYVMDKEYRTNVRQWVNAFGIAFVVAAPGILRTIAAFTRKPVDSSAWLLASKVRLPHHLYPLTWAVSDYGWFILLVSCACLVIYRGRIRHGKLFRHAILWTAVAGGWFLFSFAAAYVFKNPFLLVMHPIRGTDLWYCFTGIAVICIVLDGVHIRAAGRIAVIMMLSVAAVAGYRLYERGFRLEIPIKATLVSASDWTKAHTPVSSTFLVDPGWKSEGELWRALSQRPVFVTWRDGSAMLWDKSYAGTWDARLLELGFDIRKAKGTYDQVQQQLTCAFAALTDTRAAQLSGQFELSYWLVLSSRPSSFLVAYQNRDYKILILPHGMSNQ